MRNRWFVFGVLAFGGCSSNILPPSSEAKSKSLNPEAIDFSNWPKATKNPYLIAPAVAAACSSGATTVTARSLNLSPHSSPFIVVRVNPEAFADFLAKRPLAVGSIIIIEKHPDANGDNPPQAYTMMIKREPGYDPGHGDWEYADVRLEPEKKVSRGKIASCIACHDGKKNDDYLFRDYLK